MLRALEDLGLVVRIVMNKEKDLCPYRVFLQFLQLSFKICLFLIQMPIDQLKDSSHNRTDSSAGKCN